MSSRALVFLVLASSWPCAAAPLTLPDAYRIAAERSPRLKVAADQIADAEARKLIAWTRLGPTATISGTGTLQNQIANVSADGGTFLVQSPYLARSSATVVVPVLRKGFLDGLTAAQAGIDSAKANFDREKQLLMLEVVRSYLGVMSGRAQVAVAEAAVKRAESQLELTRAKQRAGGALRTHELLSSIDVRRAKLQVVDARANAATSMATLERLLARPPGELELPPPPVVLPLDRALELGGSRLDIEANRLRVLQLVQELSANEGRRLWPRFDIQGSADFFAPATALQTPLNYRIAGVLTIPFIEGGAEYANVAISRVALRSAEDNLRQTEEAISEEIRASHARLLAAEQRIALATEQVRDARDNFSLVQQQAKLGAVTYLEVTNAQAILGEAESIDVSAQYDYRLTAFELLGAVGVIALDP